MDNNTQVKQIGRRNSSIEILRIVCILGIVTMHVMGEVQPYIGGKKMLLALLLNSVFHTAVSLFFLISGYFGFNSSRNKIIKLELMILFYSLLGSLGVFFDGNASLSYIVSTFFPVLSGRYWFISVYMLLMILGKNLEQFLDRLERRQFEKLIVILLVFYSIAPTILEIRIVSDNRGKGVPNMILIYFVGRYIKKYLDVELDRIKLSMIAMGSILIVTFFNYMDSIKMGFFRGTYVTDDSIFIIVASICIFLICKSYKFHMSNINKLATHVLAIYLFEANVRGFLLSRLDLTKYSGDWYLFGIIAGIVICIAVICIIVDIIRNKIFGKVTNDLEEIILVVYEKIKKYFVEKWSKIIGFLEKE